MGYHTVREAGRKIIRSQAETGGNAVPWADTARYARLMSLQSRNDFEKHADLGEPCFFDRGIVDVWGYCRLIGLPVFRELKNAAEKCLYLSLIHIFRVRPEGSRHGLGRLLPVRRLRRDRP